MSRLAVGSMGFALGLCALLLSATQRVSSQLQPSVRIAVEGGLTFQDLAGLEEGGRVSLRCEARNLDPEESVVWQRGSEILTSSNRTSVELVALPKRGDASLTRNEDLLLTVDPVLGTDMGLYRCRVARYDAGQDEYFVQLSTEVTVNVYYFPTQPSPSCSPVGPVTLTLGESVVLSCQTDKGYPTANLTVSSPALASLLPGDEWPLTESQDSLTRSFRWSPTSVHQEISLTCLVTSSHFPDANASCVIGPIRVIPKFTALPSSSAPSPSRAVSTSTTATATAATTTTKPKPTPVGKHETSILTQEHPCFVWLVAFIACAAALAVSLVVNILTCVTLMRQRRAHRVDQESRPKAAFVETKNRNVLNLQLNGINNRSFTVEPLTDIGSSSPI